MEFDVTDIQFSRYDIKKGLKLPNTLSQELSYLCGIIVGDGCIFQRSDKKDYCLKVVGNPKDEQELYHEVIGPYFYKVFGFIPNIKLQDTNTTYGFSVLSKELLRFLTEKTGLNKGRKDQKLGIPEIFKNNREFLIPFIRGLFDTDGCMCFKKRYRKEPYYPVISLSSLSEKLIREVVQELKEMGFKVVESYNRQIFDPRLKNGFNIISRVELNGFANLQLWIEKINFSSPKHLNKIKRYYTKK